MSQFKGTKGRWMLMVEDKWPFSYSIETKKENVLFGIVRYSTADKCINDCLKRDPALNNEGLANALLISKAPELLEMLEEVKDYLGSDVRGKVEQLIKEATEL